MSKIPRAIGPTFLLLLLLIAGATSAAAQTGPEGSPAAPPPAPPTLADYPPPSAAPPDATVTAAPQVSEAGEAGDAPREAKGDGNTYAGSSEGILASFNGPVGLFRMSTADVGRKGHFRFGLHGEYFKSNGFLVQSDEHTRFQGGLVFGATPGQYFEIFGGLLASSNRNLRCPNGQPVGTCMRDPKRLDLPIIRAYGDVVLGSKARIPLAQGFDLGLELGLKFLSSTTGISFDADATSLWLGPLFTVDLRAINGAPLRFHVNTSYYVDNSDNLQSFPTDPTDDNLASKEVATFSYGVAQSRFRFAVGVDAPLEKVIPQLPLQPFVEYHAEIVTGDGDAFFRGFTPAGMCGRIVTPGVAIKPCRDNSDQHWFTFGVRARVYKGITADLGAELAPRSVGFRYGPPLPPYNILFGASYPLDIDSLTRTQVVTKTVEKVVTVPALPPPPTEGRVKGIVKSTRGGTPVPGAIVAVVGRPRTRAATDPDGTFVSVPIPAGPTELEASAPGFEPAKASAIVVAGGEAEIDIALAPKPPTGNVRGRIADDTGRGIEASIKFLGTENFEARSDPSGSFSASLPVGPYTARVDAASYLNKETQVELVAGQDRQMEMTLRTRPASATVSAGASGIVLKQPIKFKPKSAELDSSAPHLLDEVVDALVNHPEIKRLRVEAHWDGSLPKAKAEDLTLRQAQAVREYLVKQGIAESRLEAVGAGSAKPMVPNIGAANKAKNRRVEFVAQ